MMDDAELLRSYAETRSETAFAGFVERRVGFVYASALRQVGGDAHAAQDVTQAVFVLVAKKARRLAGHACLGGWLHTATCNVAHGVLREAWRRCAREQEALRMSEIEHEQSARGANEGENDDPAKLRPLLDEALAALREGEREAVVMRFFEGRAFADISKKFKMSEAAARMRVARAVEKMRERFARRGVTSTAAAVGALMSAEAATGAPAGLATSVSAGAVSSVGAMIATAGAGAFLIFMSSTKMTVVAIVALVAAAGGVFYGVQKERSASAALAQARQENKKLAEQLGALEKGSGAAAGAVAATPKSNPLVAGEALLAAHPEIREKVNALKKANGTKSTYRYAKALNLTPEQSDKLAEIAGRALGIVTTYKAPGYGDVVFDPFPTGPFDKSYWEEMRVVVGDENFEKLQHLWKRNYPGTSYSKELSMRLYLSDAPLTSQQAWGLDDISYDITEKFGDSKTSDERWQMFRDRAEAVLLPEQMWAFNDVGDRYILIREVSKVRAALREEAVESK
jgi:RNA polymerase sigma factor (sigma-70 family)